MTGVQTCALPILRIAEIGLVHRYEATGALSGLLRVRGFHQDDAHLFMKPEDIQPEVKNLLALCDEIYGKFGLTYHVELSTRPEKDTIGTDQEWEQATQALHKALEESGRQYRLNPGDGAFYGPKIDFHIRDALGRTWQTGTIQLDMALPERFELEYVAADGSRKRPVMLHRTIYGSIERFLAVLIEHFAGRFPLWLSPRQITIIPVADRHIPYGQEVQIALRAAGFHADLDATAESVNKKIRNAQLKQYNYMLVVGDREIENKSFTLRTRDNVVHGEMKLEPFVTEILQEKKARALQSPFAKTDI